MDRLKCKINMHLRINEIRWFLSVKFWENISDSMPGCKAETNTGSFSCSHECQEKLYGQYMKNKVRA